MWWLLLKLSILAISSLLLHPVQPASANPDLRPRLFRVNQHGNPANPERTTLYESFKEQWSTADLTASRDVVNRNRYATKVNLKGD